MLTTAVVKGMVRRVEHLAHRAVELPLVEDMILRKATDPAPTVVAHGAVHHRAASVFLYLGLAVWALVEAGSDDGCSKDSLLILLTALLAMVGRLTIFTRLVATFAYQCLTFLELSNVYYLLTVSLRAKD